MSQIPLQQPEEPFDAGDSKAVKAAIKDAKSEAFRRKETILFFMNSIDGRKYFFDLLVKCHIYDNPFSRDPGTMAFACGEMNIGQQVLVDLENSSPELYLLMLKENKETK